MKTIRAWAVTALLVSLATPALADLAPQTTNGITYVSGGVGDDEVAALQQVRGQYRLHLLFAVQGNGEYLADLPVTIANAQGLTLLQATSDGPFFFANLPAGTYRITATAEGSAITRTVMVPSSGGVEERFYWTEQPR